MRRRCVGTASALAASLLAGCAAMPGGSGGGMGFFVTSTGSGKGADLGGLAGADRHCQQLATAAGTAGKTWRAYLSAEASGEYATPVHARDRIGRGPWVNAKGAVIATDLGTLHSGNALGKETSLDEKGVLVNGSGDSPNIHDILTGSTTDGRLATGDKNLTCGNWTSSGDGAAMVGHHDRKGLDETPPAKSWNASHPTRGCSQDALKATGGGGLFYCFASN